MIFILLILGCSSDAYIEDEIYVKTLYVYDDDSYEWVKIPQVSIKSGYGFTDDTGLGTVTFYEEFYNNSYAVVCTPYSDEDEYIIQVIIIHSTGFDVESYNDKGKSVSITFMWIAISYYDQ